jgi:hypothetical protein
MQKEWVDRAFRIGAFAWAVAVLLLVASASNASPGGRIRAAGDGAAAPPAAQASPAPPVQGAPAPSPEASPAPAPGPQQEEAPPRIIRTVCTDHVCGGCDGKCRKTSGHVAVDKKGHCACTPTDGSPLDRAVRQAYERHPPQ